MFPVAQSCLRKSNTNKEPIPRTLRFARFQRVSLQEEALTLGDAVDAHQISVGGHSAREVKWRFCPNPNVCRLVEWFALKRQPGNRFSSLLLLPGNFDVLFSVHVLLGCSATLQMRHQKVTTNCDRKLVQADVEPPCMPHLQQKFGSWASQSQ